MEENLKRIFSIQHPVIFEDVPQGQEVIVLPEKIIIRTDPDSWENRYLMMAEAKLGETYHLLVNFFCQPAPSNEEIRLIGKFHNICYPLKQAWVYGTMRKYAPEIYKRELRDLKGMWEVAQDNLQRIFENPKELAVTLGIFAAIYENPQNDVNIVIVTTQQNREVWNNYIDTLKAFSRMEPSVDLYIILAEIAETPCKVRVATSSYGFRHYEVKAR